MSKLNVLILVSPEYTAEVKGYYQQKGAQVVVSSAGIDLGDLAEQIKKISSFVLCIWWRHIKRNKLPMRK
ncbi:MAG: hypothetical protein IT292_11660 [Deltaproteobacteria bacterium]|nr:hypothetical protein [Deltaproteobacteria bacterium]